MMLLNSLAKESQMFQSTHQRKSAEQLTLKVANASEAMSNVDISTYLKKS